MVVATGERGSCGAQDPGGEIVGPGCACATAGSASACRAGMARWPSLSLARQRHHAPLRCSTVARRQACIYVL